MEGWACKEVVGMLTKTLLQAYIMEVPGEGVAVKVYVHTHMYNILQGLQFQGI